MFNLFLVNDVTGHEASCMHGSPVAGETGPAAISCIGTEFQSPFPNRYSINTVATFDPQSYRFSFNQTWYCDDENPAKPYVCLSLRMPYQLPQCSAC